MSNEEDQNIEPIPETPVPPEIATQKGPEQSDEEELGGPQGPEPTRYGDWENKGRCTDF